MFTAQQLNARDATIAELVRLSNARNELGNVMRTLKPEGFDSLDFARISKAKLRQMLNDAYRAGYKSALPAEGGKRVTPCSGTEGAPCATCNCIWGAV